MLAVAGGCAPKSPTAPKPALRAVNVRVTDAGGVPVQHTFVFAVGPAEADVFTEDTDTSGTARFSLEAGAWTVYTSLPGAGGPAQVAGGTGTVGPRGGPDSVLFRLQLADESVAFGQVLLTNRTNHASSTVGVFDLPIATETLPDGSWRVDGLPPGDWLGFASHVGFEDAQIPLHVPAPRDTLTLNAITLLPAPTP